MTSFVSNTQVNSQDQTHRYSRQSYTIGQDAQTKLSKASILIIGYNTLSQEIIRNLTLIGVSKIDIYHYGELENYQKTGLYYPVDNCNQIPINHIKQLNPMAQIEIIDILNEDKKLDKQKIKKYNIVILTNSIIDDALNINEITHELNIPFIMCGSYGLMGYLFNDFGEKFIVNDIDGEEIESLILESIEGKNLKFKDPHKLSDGETIIVTLINNVEYEYKVFRKRTPIQIELTKIVEFEKNSIKKIIRKKNSQTYSFEPLKNNLDNITNIIADWSVSLDRTKLLHSFHIAYNNYLNEFGKNPRSWSISDYEVFEKYLNLTVESEIILAKKFIYTLRGNLLPFTSIIAGSVTHEVLKALAHKYIPINQWYYLDYLDLILDSEIINFDDNTGFNFRTKTKYEGIVNIFGKKFLNELQNSCPFVIGSGAIGCELIKNLGMMGVKQIYLTDPDHIEKSNLSRQFLFNDDDIRQSKAEIAAKKIKIMNSDTNVIVYKQKMCQETENIFDNTFHSKIDIYLNALDNVDARNYMDSQAIKYSKPLIDSGTMGSKGNIQVILPHLTESYGSSKDPDEKIGIPICTIKSFPYKPEHTIQWARELFETEFNQIPCLLSKYKNYHELDKLNDSDAKMLLKQLYKYEEFNLTEKYYLQLLFTIFRENYINNIQEIIDKYSKNENKEELSDKKLPIHLNFNNINLEYLQEYFLNGFELLNQIFNTNIKYNFEQKITLNDCEQGFKFNYDIEILDSNKIKDLLFPIINNIPKTYPLEFEKDNDELYHVNWITLSTNMRNIQYSINQTDLYETRRIAGNIIPAMITTTSLVSGFQILEYIRICKLYKKNKYLEEKNHKDIDYYKNRFVNLNTNYCDGINPVHVQKFKLDNDLIITTWTNFTINSNNTIDIIEQIQKQTNKKVEFMTIDSMTIFDGDDINIAKIQSNSNNVLILLEDIPIGIPVFII